MPMLEQHLNVVTPWEDPDHVAGVGVVESDAVPAGPHPRVGPLGCFFQVGEESRCEVSGSPAVTVTVTRTQIP